MTIQLPKLRSMLKAETAADSFWDGLSDKAKRAYLKAHPRSKYGKKPVIPGVTHDPMGTPAARPAANSGYVKNPPHVKGSHSSEIWSNHDSGAEHKDIVNHFRKAGFHTARGIGPEMYKTSVFHHPDRHAEVLKHFQDLRKAKKVGPGVAFSGPYDSNLGELPHTKHINQDRALPLG